MFRLLVPLRSATNRRAALRLLMLVLSLGIWACRPESSAEPARAAVLDLRGADFGQGAVRLGGLWELYPGELRHPSQLPPGQPGDTRERLATNEPWSRHRLTTGTALRSQGALTLRLRVLLPARRPSAEPWVLKAVTRARAMRVFARERSGQELMQPLSAGVVSTDLDRVRGSKRTQIAPLLLPAVSADEQAAELELVVQLASRDTPEISGDIHLFLGRDNVVRGEQAAEEQVQLLIIGTCLVVGLYHLAMFAIRRSEPAPLFFGLFCLAIVIRLFMLHGFLEARLLGSSWPLGLAWERQERLEYCGFFLAVPLFTLYLAALFPKQFARRALEVLLAVALATCAWTLLLPIYPASFSVAFFEKVTLAVVAYIVFGMARVLLRGQASDQQTARLIAAGTLLLVGAAANDILHNNKIIKTFVAEHYAMFAFIFCQAFVLAQNNARARLRAEKLADELDHKNAALEKVRKDLQLKFGELKESNAKFRSLNEELLRQIDQRSRHLLDAVLRQPGPNSRPPLQLAPESQLGEVYRVVRTLGQGAMGAVYEVERTTDHQRLAAKILSTEQDRPALMRFAREAQLLAKLVHPNLIQIVDVDVTAGGTLFLVMELVTGTTLREQRGRYGELSWALPILQQVAAALSAVHERGIVHRDVKPANVLIAEGAPGSAQLVKLADFGVSVMAREHDQSSPGVPAVSQLAELTEDELAGTQSVRAPAAEAATDREPDANPSATQAATHPDDLTEAGALVGTPMYMAPELSFGSRQAQSASDIFSFGVIAYELITKEMPFKKPTVGAAGQPEALPIPSGFRLCHELGPELIFLLESALSADPAQRPTAAQLAQALGAR